MQCDNLVQENIKTFKNIIPNANNPFQKYDSGMCNSSCDLENNIKSTGTINCLLCKKVQNKMSSLFNSSGVNSLPSIMSNRSRVTTNQCKNIENRINKEIRHIASQDLVIARQNENIKVLKEKLILKDALMKKIREKVSNLDTNLNESVVKEKSKGRTGFDVWNYYLFGVNTDSYVWFLIIVSLLFTLLFIYLTYEAIMALINYLF
jgi:hypothetical protein